MKKEARKTAQLLRDFESKSLRHILEIIYWEESRFHVEWWDGNIVLVCATARNKKLIWKNIKGSFVLTKLLIFEKNKFRILFSNHVTKADSSRQYMKSNFKNWFRFFRLTVGRGKMKIKLQITISYFSWLFPTQFSL